MVLYTGRRAWKQPLTLKAMMEAPEELGAFIPQWSTLFVDLQQTPPERLLGLGEASLLALRALQAVDEPKETLAAALREVDVRLDALPQEAQGSLRKALIYLYQVVRHKRAADEQEDLFSVLDEAVEQHVSERKEAKVTGAQVIFGQGTPPGSVGGEVRRVARRRGCEGKRDVGPRARPTGNADFDGLDASGDGPVTSATDCGDGSSGPHRKSVR
jgi:hypothetical protein